MEPSGEHRVVVITGANRGIGYHMLQGVREDGYRVAGLDLDGDNLEPLAAEHPDRVRFERCDVTEPDEVEGAIEAVLEAWDRIDVLVNNAGIARFDRFEDSSVADARQEFEVNYFGGQHAIRAVLPHMRRRDSGIIHNVSSGVAIGGHPGMTGYAATKGAVEAFVRSLRIELHDEAVAVTLMQPPMTATRMTEGLGYPDWLLNDPAEVGRKLADEIESTETVIPADWQTRVGLTLIELCPSLWRAATRRFVDLDL